MKATPVVLISALLLAAVMPLPAAAAAVDDDPYLWLEEVEGEKALKWVKERSARDTAEIEAVPGFEAIHSELLEIYNSRDRIPGVSIQGAWLYNFWQDEDHVRGIWRRTFLDQYVEDEPVWETVLDLDALAEAEGENWVWKGANLLEPDYRRGLVSLSRGGSDASVVREFDTVAKTFVEDGFFVPAAKSRVSWKDEDTVWIGTDFGEGSLTTSGYPRLVKEWRRGTPLAEARTVFEGSLDDVSVGAYTMFTPEGRYDIVYRAPAFFRGFAYLILDDRLVKLDIPEDAQLRGIVMDQMLVSLRSEWSVDGTTYPQDALLAIDLDRFLAGARDFAVLFEPQERVALDQVRNGSDFVLMSVLDNVRSRLYRLTPSGDGWSHEEIALPGIGTAGIGSISEADGTYFLTYTDLLTPSSLYLVQPGQEPRKVKTTPEFFDTEGMSVAQHEATSKDGTRIPYFVLMPAGFAADGSNPTLLYGYGGFEVSMEPRYQAAAGKAWVERGGVYVLANIRGGGEFGPRWHQAALRENRQKAFDDFIAVAEDLIARGVTSPEHLGIAGGSNGGLLVGAAFVQRPELFNAVVCQVPLLDMKRYNKLLAGASWMAEYGNPDTDDWEFMKAWSPYQNLDRSHDYPQVFFTTSTRDDRVHPGHARKMVAKMTGMKKPVYYYENTEGGHGGAANNNQRAYMWALSYAYLWKMLR
ncbi:MAG: prolyl oligopeptidase family serine peptidase [Candidatus Krumholzibacteriia bacterium]